MEFICDVFQEASNMPCEDRYCIRIKDNIHMYAVFDGHGGTVACDIACDMLLSQILAEMCAFKQSHLSTIKEYSDISPESMNKIIQSAFVDCDNHIYAKEYGRLFDNSAVNSNIRSSPRGMKSFRMKASFAGSCACIAIIIESFVYIVNLGDCRAIMVSGENVASPVPTTSGVRKRKLDELLESNVRNIASPIATVSIPNSDDLYEGFYAYHMYVSGAPKTDLDSGAITYGEVQGDIECKRNNTANLTRSNEIDVCFSEVSVSSSAMDIVDRDQTGRYTHVRVATVTTDHSCNDIDEIWNMKQLSSDPNPVRPGARDKAVNGSLAMNRVAGSLSVTRAFGDMYLKKADISLNPYQQHVPYITCHPTVYFRKLHSRDTNIILASDGLFNFVDNQEIADVLAGSKYEDCAKTSSENMNNEEVKSCLHRMPSEFGLCSHRSTPEYLHLNNCSGHPLGSKSIVGSNIQSGMKKILSEMNNNQCSLNCKHARSVNSTSEKCTLDSPSFPSLSAALMHKCFSNCAASSNKAIKELVAMQPGSDRRRFIDDVTILNIAIMHNRSLGGKTGTKEQCTF